MSSNSEKCTIQGCPAFHTNKEHECYVCKQFGVNYIGVDHIEKNCPHKCTLVQEHARPLLSSRMREESASRLPRNLKVAGECAVEGCKDEHPTEDHECMLCGSRYHIEANCSTRCTIKGCPGVEGCEYHCVTECLKLCTANGCGSFDHTIDEHTCDLCMTIGASHTEFYCPKRCKGCFQGYTDPHTRENHKCEVCREFGHLGMDCPNNDGENHAYNLARLTSHFQTITYLKAGFGTPER